VAEKGFESYNRNHGTTDNGTHGKHGTHGTHGTVEQSTGSMNMAQVIAAMQAIARSSSRLSHISNTGELIYSDNFEEPSCTSIHHAVTSSSIRPTSQASRPLSARSMSPVKSRLSNRASYSRETSNQMSNRELEVSPPNNEVVKPKSSRNTRYQKKATVHYDSDTSSTTTTTSSTTYVRSRRRKSNSRSTSKSKSLSRQSSARSISPIKSNTSFIKKVSSASDSSPAMSNKGCQTPVPSRSMSIQTVESSDNSSTTQQTMVKSPTRVVTPHSPFREQTPRVPSEMTDCHSDHSSLRSGSIYIGDSDDVSEEDPLKLSYLLSTESIQFSDDDHPTSLLKLCSPSEARVANKFMYTF